MKIGLLVMRLHSIFVPVFLPVLLIWSLTIAPFIVLVLSLCCSV